MDKQAKLATDFSQSMRGKFIIAQALYYGIKALESVKPEYLQEKSNIADMKHLQHAYPFPTEFFDVDSKELIASMRAE